MADTVLVTRPAGQAQALCEQLTAAGYNAVHRPLLTICEREALEPVQRWRIQNLDRYRHIIFVSANAVRCGMHWIEQFQPRLPADINWYAVGDRSAGLLSERGLRVIKPGRMDSEGLLALSELQNVDRQRVLLVKGEQGRTLIQQRLTRRGALVDLLEVYRRLPPDLSAESMRNLFTEQKFRALLISSGEGLKNMLHLLGDNAVQLVGDTPVIVPGQRVGALAVASGIASVIVARNATDEAMLEALAQDRPRATRAAKAGCNR